MTFDELKIKAAEFVQERDWDQFHKPKDVAISLAIEAAELLEQFQWKDDAQVAAHVQAHREDVADEMADVLLYLMSLSNKLQIDLVEAAEKKIAKNAKKYPIEKVKGKSDKYTTYQ